MFIYSNFMQESCAFIVFFLIALIFCITILCVSFFLGDRSSARYTHTPFESGIASVGNAHIRFSIKFYLVAMFFVIFDVEALYLYGWAVNVREVGWLGFLEVIIFVFTLLIGLFYLIRMNALNWSPIYTNKKSL